MDDQIRELTVKNVPDAAQWKAARVATRLTIFRAALLGLGISLAVMVPCLLVLVLNSGGRYGGDLTDAQQYWAVAGGATGGLMVVVCAILAVFAWVEYRQAINEGAEDYARWLSELGTPAPEEGS